MPRIRSIKPEHWGDKYLPNISVGAHLLWIGMWNFSDDKGIIEHDCHLLKSNIFPRRKEIKPSQIEKWVKELIKYKFVLPFQHKDSQYLIHRTFDVHQKIDKPQKSKIEEDVIRRVFAEQLPNHQEPILEPSDIIQPQDRIGEDKEGKREDGKPPTDFSMIEIFNKSWDEYRVVLNGHSKLLSEEIFSEWKFFVSFISQNDLTDLLKCKFITPIDFGKLQKEVNFPRDVWLKVLKKILSTGIKPEHNLYFRIPDFIKYAEKDELHAGDTSKTAKSTGKGAGAATLLNILKAEHGKV